MKKSTCLILALVLLVLPLCACQNSDFELESDFMDVQWTRSTDADTEYIRFSSEGSFSYYCACGNPVNDSDLCEGYTYDPDKGIIKLKYDFIPFYTTKIKVLKCDGETLTLKFPDGERIFTVEKEEEFSDTITYDDKTYELLEYPEDIFRYSYYTEEYPEHDLFHVSNEYRDAVYKSENLYIEKSEIEDAILYYADDENYSWFVSVNHPDYEDERTYAIDITEEDLDYIYSMEDMEKEMTVFFDRIEIFGTLKKISRDGLVCASADLYYINSAWYWNSGEIDTDTEGWPEYAIPLPESLSAQINKSMNND